MTMYGPSKMRKQLQWRHNERDGVSDDRCLNFLLSLLLRRIAKKTSKLSVTGLCEGNSPVSDEFAAQRDGKCFYDVVIL